MTGHIGMGLTPGQAKVLAVIQQWSRESGFAPTVREIAAETKFWVSKVHRQLVALEGKGYIRRFPNQARAIDLTAQGMQWSPRPAIRREPQPSTPQVMVNIPVYNLRQIAALAKASIA